MVTIGVLITSHGERTKNGMLSRCIQSVLDQERVPDQMVVAIDHGGVLGAAANKQAALNCITTDFCAVIDSDDWMLSEHIKTLEEAQELSNADLVYSWFLTEPPGNDPFPEYFFTDPWDHSFPRHTTTTIMGRTSIMKKIGYSADPNPSSPQSDDDWRMTLGMVELGASIYHVPERTWVWNHHGKNTSGLPTRRSE